MPTISEETYQKLEARAQQEGKTVEEFIIAIIEEALGKEADS